MEVICFPETSVDSHRTTRRYILENGILHSDRCENLKPNILSESYVPCLLFLRSILLLMDTKTCGILTEQAKERSGSERYQSQVLSQLTEGNDGTDIRWPWVRN
jgi:hypothetical protein